jgi:hypothetical protein
MERSPESSEESVVATGTRRRNRIRLLDDVVDDATTLVNDVVQKAKDLDRDSRKALRQVASDNGDDRRDRSAWEIDDLKSALDDLTSKVNRLVALRADGRSPFLDDVAEPVRASRDGAKDPAGWPSRSPSLEGEPTAADARS